jgi:PAS domain-containing protein
MESRTRIRPSALDADRSRLLFETMAQGVLFHDREGRITHANPRGGLHSWVFA